MVQVVLCCFYALLFVWIIYKNAFFKLPGISSRLTVLFFLLKIVATTGLWSIFICYYPSSDATVFFDDSKILYDTFFDHPLQFFQLLFGAGENVTLQAIKTKMQIWDNSYSTFLIHDSRTMIRLNALFRFFSLGYFYVHGVWMCFLSFIGLVSIYKLFFPYLHRLKFLLIIACFLLPSVLFWSSTVLKEGIIFLGLGLFLYHTQCGLRSVYRFRNVMGLLLGMILLILVKIYVLIAICPALLANFWIAASNHRYIVLKYMMSYLFLLLLVFSLHYVSPSLDFAKIVRDKQTDFINVAKGGIVLSHDSTQVYINYDDQEEYLQCQGSIYKLKGGYRYAFFKQGNKDTLMLDGSTDTSGFAVLYTYVPAGSAFSIHRLKPSLMEILKNAPLAFWNTLIIPSLYTFPKTFSGLVLAENMLLLFFIVVVLLFFLKKEFPLAMTLFCLSFVLILFSLIGLTTPVLGALVRYRIPGIPFLMIGFALMADEKKIIAFYSRLKGNLFRQ